MKELSREYELWLKVMQKAGLSYGPADVFIAALETANADLPEALKDILEILGHIPEDDPHETWRNVNDSIQEAYDIANDAIRKHKGEGK